MPDKVTTLAMPTASDQEKPGASNMPTGSTPGAMADIASFKKRRREPAETEFNADFDELCGLLGERFARIGALDAHFCQLVGLLPELRNVKDRVLVREAKIVAACLARDDIKAPTAQLVVNGLASRLRPFSGLPAGHVMLGILMFLGALVAIDVLLSYFWQTSSWNLEDMAQSGGFYIFNVSPWLIIAIATAGGLGSIVSMLTRIQSFSALAGTDRRVLWMIGAMRPVIGITFALFIFAVLQAQILPFNFPEGPKANFEYVALAFIAGFSERLSRGVMSTVEGKFLGHKPE
jgi:hypothetical protein